MEHIILSTWFLVLVLVIAIWELIWKGFALWKSARNKDLAWFVCILIFNTAGILPIIYLAFFSDEKKVKTKKRKTTKKK